MTPEYIIGLIAAVLISLIGYLLNRSIAAIDQKMDTTCSAVEAMKLEMKGYETLTQYLKNDVDNMKTENASLRKSLAVMDKWIYRLGQRTGHPTPEEPLD